MTGSFFFSDLHYPDAEERTTQWVEYVRPLTLSCWWGNVSLATLATMLLSGPPHWVASCHFLQLPCQFMAVSLRY